MIFAFDPSSLDLYQPGAFLPSFSANAPVGLLVSCLNVSVFVASSNTAYDSASWANAWLPQMGRHIKIASKRRAIGGGENLGFHNKIVLKNISIWLFVSS